MPTIYKNRRNQMTATRTSVEEVAAAIRELTYQKEVENFRLMRPLSGCKRGENGALDKVDAPWEKALPRIGFACDCVKREGAMRPVAYNGLIVLEVTNLSAPDAAISLRGYAGLLPQTLLTFVGADGLSVVIVCRAELLLRDEALRNLGTKEAESRLPQQPDSSDTLSFHRNAYAKAQAFYTAQLGVTVDFLEPRLDRVCYMSADAALTYNPRAIPFYADAGETLPVASRYQQPLSEAEALPGRDRYHTQVIAIQECLAKAYEDTLTIADEQERLVAVLSRQAHYCMESGIAKEVALRQTLFHPELAADRMLASRIFDNAYTPKALRRAIRKNPELAVLSHIPESTLLMLRMNVFMEQNYQFRKNVLTGVAQYRSLAVPYSDFADVTEEVRNTMPRRALEAGLKSWDKDIRRYIESEDIPPYDPIDDYLQHLPAWDGKDRLADLARRVPTESPLWQRFFPLWIRSMVAHWMGRDRNHGNALVPLLIGPQGCGKTTFCGLLLPPELRAYYNDRVNFRNEYDLLNQLSSFALVNIDEFDSIGNSQQAQLKYLLSKPDVKLRVPYGKAISRRRRYASFVATTNQQQPLTDPSGARRFLCVSIEGRIDTDMRIDYQQLYAQLLAEIQSGQRYWPTDEETAELISYNERFRRLDSVDEMVRLLYRRPEVGEQAQEVLTMEIVQHMKRHFAALTVTQSLVIEVGRVLGCMGCTRRHTMKGNAWTVVLRE